MLGPQRRSPTSAAKREECHWAPDVDIWEVTSRVSRVKDAPNRPSKNRKEKLILATSNCPGTAPVAFVSCEHPKTLCSPRYALGEPPGLQRNVEAAARYMFPSRLKYAYCEMMLSFLSVKSGVARRRSLKKLHASTGCLSLSGPCVAGACRSTCCLRPERPAAPSE